MEINTRYEIIEVEYLDGNKCKINVLDMLVSDIIDHIKELETNVKIYNVYHIGKLPITGKLEHMFEPVLVCETFNIEDVIKLLKGQI